MKTVSDKKFVREYMKAYKQGLNNKEFAAKLGVSYATVHLRAKQYVEDGVKLPKLSTARRHAGKASVQELNAIVEELI